MKFITEDILPKDKRKTASPAVLLKAYVELEKFVLSLLNDGTAVSYEVFSKQFGEITEKVRNIEINQKDDSDEEYPDFVQKYTRVSADQEMDEELLAQEQRRKNDWKVKKAAWESKKAERAEKRKKDQEFVMEYLQKAGKISDSLKQMRENSKLSMLISEEVGEDAIEYARN